MAAPTDRTGLRNARAAFQSARTALLTAMDNVGTTSAALDAAERKFTAGRPELVAAQNAAAAAVTAATAARAADKSSRANVLAAITAWTNNVSVDDDLARLSTTTPLVLFPVRIETRFDLNPTAPVMRLRIYPDEIFVNLHEQAITRDEYGAAINYYTQRDKGVAEPELWRQMVQQMSSERAAYVLRLMSPTVTGGTSGTSGGTSGTSGGHSLVFPSNIVFKPGDFSRPGEGILPDRWIVRVIRGTTSQDFVGPPIPEPLTLTPDPATKNANELATIPGTNPPLQVADELVWTVDFGRAQAAGMAFTIPLNGAQAAVGTGGFDRVIVFGVKSSLDQNETPAMLEALFDGHHYTRGLALVGQGTPTNNTEDNPSPYPIDDPDGVVSFAIERARPPVQATSNQVSMPDALPDNSGVPGQPLQNIANDPTSDGAVLAWYLGLHNGVFQNVAGTTDKEQWRARQMAKLLFPATLGYFVEQILQPVFTSAHYTQIHDYFIGYVRGRGPAPAFRVGQVPYGVLPALSLGAWQSRGTTSGEKFETSALDTVRRAAGIWKRAALTGVPVVKASSTTPLNDLMQVLALYPSSREVRVRNSRGKLTEYNTATFLGIDFRQPANTLQSIVGAVLSQVNQPGWANSLLGGMVFNDTANLVSIPLVAPPTFLGETQQIPPSFFGNMSNTTGPTVAALLSETVTLPSYDTAGQSKLLFTLFYKLIRQALLWSRVRAARTLASNVHIQVAGIEIELNNIGTTVFGQTPSALLLSTAPVLGLPAGTVLGDAPAVLADPQVQDTVFALQALASSSTAEIDRLFSETLDVTSHRLDAWITAYANRRLLEMRSAQISSTMMPVGSYFGGYAMVENVRPVARTVVNVPGFGSAETQAGNGGFIQAPSLAHATAAAVLRNGYLSYGGETTSTQTKYAFDLSSARVRAAREILDELRAGQPLGAAFGYKFERAVQENYPTNLGLDAYRFALRNHYPLVANKAGTNPVPTALVSTVAARNVVDGLALWQAFQANTIPWDTATDLPRRTIVVNGKTVPNPPFTALSTEIARLGEAIDGVSDLNIGEGVLQLVRSNVTNAAGNLDALARGARPPDPHMGLSQRGGLAVTHRVALVFPNGQTPQSPGWPVPPSGVLTPRALAEPLLDAWAGSILGDPTNVTAKVTMNPLSAAGTATQVTVSLGALGLRPLDLVAIARAPAAANSGSILDRRIAARAATQANDPTRTPGKIDYGAPAGARTIPQVVEVARALGALFGGARSLGSDDLTTAFDAPDARDSTVATNLLAAQALRGLAATATSTLTTVSSALAAAVTAGSGLAAALSAAAAYFPDAFPAPGASDAALLVTAGAISTQLQARVTDAGDAVTPQATTAEGIVAQSQAQLRAVFGPDFVAVPSMTPPNAPELDQSLGARATLLPGADDAPTQFLQQAAQVYDGLSRHRTLSLYMGAFGIPLPRLDVAQLPYAPGEQWIGLQFGSDNPPSPGRLSLLLYSFGAAAPDATLGWRGLVLQDWVEVIPETTEKTGLAFNYDNPGAEAAQAVLVLPPSSTGTVWKQNDVWGTLGETLDLAKIRAVDLQLVGIGQLVPALYMAHNLQSTTIFTGFLGELFNIVQGLT